MTQEGSRDMEAKMKVAMIGVGSFGGYRRERIRETGLFEIVAAYDLNRGWSETWFFL